MRFQWLSTTTDSFQGSSPEFDNVSGIFSINIIVREAVLYENLVNSVVLSRKSYKSLKSSVITLHDVRTKFIGETTPINSSISECFTTYLLTRKAIQITRVFEMVCMEEKSRTTYFVDVCMESA